MRSVSSRVLWAVAAALQACTIPAAAGTLEVAPTTVVLQEAGKAGVLYIYNYGAAAITVQVEPFDWQQANGWDQLVPSRTLMSSPPIAAIPPQGKQTVRLMATPDGAATERNF